MLLVFKKIKWQQLTKLIAHHKEAEIIQLKSWDHVPLLCPLQWGKQSIHTEMINGFEIQAIWIASGSS